MNVREVPFAEFACKNDAVFGADGNFRRTACELTDAIVAGILEVEVSVAVNDTVANGLEPPQMLPLLESRYRNSDKLGEVATRLVNGAPLKIGERDGKLPLALHTHTKASQARLEDRVKKDDEGVTHRGKDILLEKLFDVGDFVEVK